MKRSTSGGIAAAFAKAPPARPKKQKEEEKETPPTSKPASPEPVPRISAKRQKELDEINKMMEDDEEPQRTIPPGISKQKLMIELEDFPPDAPVEGGEEKVETPAESGAETPTEDIPKRKRGKRKVLKKTTKRDEKGYLGTPSLHYPPLLLHFECTVNEQLPRTSMSTNRSRRRKKVILRQKRNWNGRRVLRRLVLEGERRRLVGRVACPRRV